MSTSAAAAPAGSTGPRIVSIAPGSLLLPQGADSTKLAAMQQQAAAATPGPAADIQAGAQAAADAAAPKKPEIPMSARLAGVIPLATGLAQALIGFAIMRGNVATAGIPILGKLPKLVIGILVSGTSTQSIMAGAQRLLGKA